jgi:hypothetical protein
MAAKYYYFVAGLPDLLLDEGKQVPTCVDFAEEAVGIFSEADRRRFNLLRLPFDNENLIGMLVKKEHGFDRRASIDEATLAAGLKSPLELPEYMQEFLAAYRENRSPLPGLSVHDQLAWFFYETTTTHRDAFIRQWYTFDLSLRNVLAGIACRRNLEHLDALAEDRGSCAPKVVIGRDDVAEAVLRSNAPDFGLAAQHPWVEQVLVLSKGKPIDFEKGIDTVRWNMLSEMSAATYFEAETVFAWYLKLTIVERWRALDPAEGRARLDTLLEELGASFTVEDTNEHQG